MQFLMVLWGGDLLWSALPVMKEDSCGYCLVNNVALCARAALAKGVSRVLIVDWDVHHGQGTQREFYDDNRVLYVSIHRYEHGGWRPNLRESNFDHIGSGPGVGYNCNIPLNKVGMTDMDYLSAWHLVVLPLAVEFEPQLVLVSAGFDPALGCPEGEQRVSPATFAHLLHSLQAFAGSRVLALLEGGYFLPSLVESAALTLRQLLGSPCPRIPDKQEPVSLEMEDSIRGVQVCLAPYWKCFNHLEGTPFPEQRWEGPTEAESAPFDIMSPTPPREEAEERDFGQQVSKLVAETCLNKPQFKLAIDSKGFRCCQGKQRQLSQRTWKMLLK